VRRETESEEVETEEGESKKRHREAKTEKRSGDWALRVRREKENEQIEMEKGESKNKGEKLRQREEKQWVSVEGGERVRERGSRNGGGRE
jgi:hypothetical protein